jgi:hypothetical protein
MRGCKRQEAARNVEQEEKGFERMQEEGGYEEGWTRGERL